MKTLTCPDLTPDIVRGWLGNRLDEARAAEVRQHLRGRSEEHTSELQSR